MSTQKNTVTVTFASAGSEQLEDSFSGVGASGKKMGEDVHTAAEKVEGFRDSADKAEQRAMGFRDTITGVQDSAKGLGSILSGDLSPQSFLTLGMGVGDLASGFSNLLIPALGSAGVAIKGFSMALLTSPITWIVVGVGLLVAAFVVLWTKCEGFRDFWKGLWSGIKETAGKVWDWFGDLPDKTKTIFEKVGGFIIAPYKFAFNTIADLWNNTVGRLSFTVPSWVPFIGDKGFSMPQIPKWHTGGIVPGAPGQEVLGILQAGERITPAGSSTSSGAPVVVSGSSLMARLLEELMEELRGRGLTLVAVPG